MAEYMAAGKALFFTRRLTLSLQGIPEMYDEDFWYLCSAFNLVFIRYLYRAFKMELTGVTMPV